MDISTLAKIPKLAKIEISDQDIVDAYGDIITFWIIDEMGIGTYFDFYKLQQAQDSDSLNALFRKIILKEDGSPALGQGEVFPINLTLAVLVAINNFLGKSNTKQVTATTGDEQS